MRIHNYFVFIILFSVINFSVIAGEFSGNISAELKAFKNEAQLDEQEQFYGSLAFQPEFFHDFSDGDQRITFTGFGRYSPANESRNHVDIRELFWSYFSDDWELRAGIRKVFWGVTESQHLVDIINQTDTLEGFDGEEKLGQPMLHLSWFQDWGTTEFFVLPGFRKREFSSEDARLRPPFLIESSDALYESDAEEKHVDLAIRWTHVLGDWDVGFSHFYGTNREPRLILDPSLINMPQTFIGTQPIKLVPYYDIINQTGLDVQATLDNWLWKAEAIYRSGMSEDFYATTIGLEYSFFDIQSTGVDIGLVLEHLYDDRGTESTNPFENDIMTGFRLALNDEQSTEALFGVIQDINGDASILSVEASRRLGEQFKLIIEGLLFTETNENDFMHNFRSDDYIQIELAYYF